jgi:hypothetical protein
MCMNVCMYVYIYLCIYLFTCLTTPATCQAHSITLHFTALTILNEVYKWIPFFFHGSSAPSGPRPPHFWAFNTSLRHTTLGWTPLDDWSARRRDLYLTIHNTHNRQNFMPPGEIRTRNPSKRVAADLRLRPRGHRDRLNEYLPYTKCFSNKHFVVYRPYKQNMPMNRPMRFVMRNSVVETLNTLRHDHYHVTWQQHLGVQRKKITNRIHVFWIIVMK